MKIRSGSATAWAAVTLAVVLSACRTVPLPAQQAWPARRAELQTLAVFRLSGRFAAAHADQAMSAGLDWAQRDADTRLHVRAPLGMGSVEVRSDGGQLHVVAANGVELSGDDARGALRSLLGFEPPLSQLRYWLLGVPDASLPAEETLDGEQRLAQLQQAGWTVQYQSYQPVGRRWLPQRIRLTRADWRLQLAVNHWQL